MPKLKYKDKTHQYFIGKREVPSVSKLVEYACGTSYANIPEDVLKKAGEYGTAVHEAIEDYENGKGNTSMFSIEVDKYIELKAKYLLNVESMEQMVTDGKNYGGRYDILATDGTIWDIKTTSKPYLEKWEWQLSLYAYGLKKPNKVGFIIYIPKRGKHKVIMVNLHSFDEVKCLIDMYNEEHNGDTV